MKTLRLISRLIVGLVFLFSGFVKAVDPWGSAYKFHDYFIAFNMEWFTPLALILGILLCLLEFLIGAALVFNVKMKWASWGVLLFMSFFTILTFYLAIANPVSDCGCFGDAIVLTNWQTFYKNIILMIFTIIIFINRNKYTPIKIKIYDPLILTIAALLLLSVVYYSYNHLPLIDFLPWKIGNKISELVIPTPEEAEITLIYKHKKTGELLEYTTKNLPYQDTALWNNIEFVEQKKKIIKPFIEPPIKDFFIRDTANDDYTNEIITNKQFQFLLVSYDINKAKIKNLLKLKSFADSCKANNISFVLLSGSSADDTYKILNENKIDFPVFFVDATALKSVVRANPGLVLLYDGIVADKWHYNDFPEWNHFLKNKEKYNSIIHKKTT
ncbi:MAG TPA: DoxX family protein [Bacteroidales bacterium]|nr:DoxX family protein [Bacteroidales bacterium]